MPTQLVFSTPPGAESIPVGQTKSLGTVGVGNFQTIRVFAGSRLASQSDVTIRLVIIERGAAVANLLTLNLRPGSQSHNLLSMPGTTLEIVAATTPPAPGPAILDMLVYGFQP
jgi:hypothetical protein